MLLRAHAPILLPLLDFGLSLVREVCAGCHQPLLLTGSSRRYFAHLSLWLPGPLPRRSHRVHVPVNFPDVIGLPQEKIMGRLPASFHERDFSWRCFRGCRHSVMFRPPSLLAFQIAPTASAKPKGGQGFYVRAERASLPRHAPDMLAVRIQAIDGTRTRTLPDTQHCRLLPFLPTHTTTALYRSSLEAV